MPDGIARGTFIALEGGEGTGKSTQCAALAGRLRAAGLEVVETREPGGTAGAEAVRALLKSGALERYGADVEAMLISAARADHVAQVIRPALEAGTWVVCDRFSGSTRVYQGAGSGVAAELIDTLERVSTAGTLPDLVVVLDIPADVGVRRARERMETEGVGTDRFEKQSLAYHRRLRTAFRDLVRQQPDRHILIDASGEPREVSELIWTQVARRFGIQAAKQPVEEADGGAPNPG